MSTPEEILAVICPAMLATSGYAVYLELATNQTSSGYFGVNYSLAVALRAAHQYTVNAKRAGASGFVTQRTEGRLSQSFGGFGKLNNELQTTAYGAQLYELIHTHPGFAVSSLDIYEQYLGG